MIERHDWHINMDVGTPSGVINPYFPLEKVYNQPRSKAEAISESINTATVLQLLVNNTSFAW